MKASALTATLQRLDNRVLHPWDSIARLGHNRRTVMERSEGVYVYDTDGNKLLDGPGGMWCVNVGHGRAGMAAVMAEQARRMAYYSPWALANAPAARLAEKLASLSPGDLNRVFYTTGGSAAVDSALRFVMFYNNLLGRPRKKIILSRERAYHGSTYLSASCSGKERDKNYFDFADHVVRHLAAPDPLRRPAGLSVERFCDGKVAELEQCIVETGPERVAAFIAEPVQASGGVVIAPPGYHRRCLEVCRRYEVLYISDEVVTGFGRLGHFFASEAVFDIVPDIIVCAKGLTSGYAPLGAVLISDRLLEDLGGGGRDGVFSNGFTYSGHPVCCAVALENIRIIEEEGLLQHVREVAPYFARRLASLERMPLVANVRSIGLMGGVECTFGSGAPADSGALLQADLDIGARVDKHCQALGLLVRPLINMCVMSPPLVISRAQVDEMVSILERGITRTMEELRDEAGEAGGSGDGAR